MLDSLWTYLGEFRSIHVDYVYVHQKRTWRRRKKRNAANNCKLSGDWNPFSIASFLNL